MWHFQVSANLMEGPVTLHFPLMSFMTYQRFVTLGFVQVISWC